MGSSPYLVGSGGGGFSQLAINLQTGTSYTIQDSDRGKAIIFSNVNAIAVTLPQAGIGSAFPSGWFTYIKNKNIGYVTITPTVSKIDGCIAMFVPPGATCLLLSDGTNYFVLATDMQGTPGTALGTYFIIDGTSRLLGSGGGLAIVTAANEVNGNVIQLSVPQVVGHIVLRVSGGIAAQTAAIGITDVSTNGNKLFSTGAFSIAVSNAIINIAVGPFLMLPGAYTVCWTCTSITATIFQHGFGSIGSSDVQFAQNGNNRFFKSTNTASAGDIPATLGAIIATTLQYSSAPCVVFES